MCREHGLQLTGLAADEKWSDVAFWGVVKETGVDDVGLLEFYEKYFKFPLYKDDELQIYKAQGNRKIKLRTFNPFSLWKGYKDMGRRIAAKNIEGNMVGEGLIQGGILVFNKAGEIKYALEENVGRELELDDIRTAVNAVREGREVTPAKTEL